MRVLYGDSVHHRLNTTGQPDCNVVSLPPLASVTCALAGKRQKGRGGVGKREVREGDGGVRVRGGGVDSRIWRTAGAAGHPHVSDGWRRPSKAGAGCRSQATRLKVPRRVPQPAKFWPRHVGSCRVKCWRRLLQFFWCWSVRADEVRQMRPLSGTAVVGAGCSTSS